MPLNSKNEDCRSPSSCPITEQIHQAVLKVPATALTAAVEPGGEIPDAAGVAEPSGDCLKSWP